MQRAPANRHSCSVHGRAAAAVRGHRLRRVGRRPDGRQPRRVCVRQLASAVQRNAQRGAVHVHVIRLRGAHGVPRGFVHTCDPRVDQLAPRKPEPADDQLRVQHRRRVRLRAADDVHWCEPCIVPRGDNGGRERVVACRRQRDHGGEASRSCPLRRRRLRRVRSAGAHHRGHHGCISPPAARNADDSPLQRHDGASDTDQPPRHVLRHQLHC
mmetsp:Transcript_13502/g.42032  ORF Transcript_13502/g.42032 Transcript_13502/m.42032 type:complete len:212 (+) Transcript_13502:54-689(+)